MHLAIRFILLALFYLILLLFMVAADMDVKNLEEFKNIFSTEATLSYLRYGILLTAFYIFWLIWVIRKKRITANNL